MKEGKHKMKQKGVLYWILLILFIIGVVESIFANPTGMLIPLLVFGAIYYFYKHPEKLYRLFNSNVSYRSHNQTKKKRKNPFIIIKGKKDDDQPKYH